MEMENPVKAATQRRRRRRQACVWFTAAAFLAIVLLIIILAVTVFKARSPTTTINSVSVSNLTVSFRGLLGGGIPLSLNLTLAVDVSVRNPNKVGITYSNSSALLDYKGDNVGEAPIPAGRISAGETMPLNLTLTVMANRFLSNSGALLGDVMSGTLPLTAHTNVTGKVSILGFIHIRVASHSTCNFNVSIANRNISGSSCSYETKL